MPIKPIYELWRTPPKHISCVIQPGLLPTGGIYVIGGEPGIGKSWMAQQMAFEISSGKRALGLFPTKQSRVVYLELEKRSDIARNRFVDNVWKKKYPESGNFLGHYDDDIPRMDTTTGRKKMENLVAEFGAEVMVVDSYAVTYMDEVDSTTNKNTISNYRQIAKEHNMAFILIHHLTKRGADYDRNAKEWHEEPIRLDNLRGNKIFHYEVDTVVGLTKYGRLERQMTFLKHSFSSAPYQDLEPMVFNYSPASAIPMQLKDNKMAGLLELVDMGINNYHELSSYLEISRPTLRRIVDDLCEMRLIIKDESTGRKESSVHLPEY